MQLLMNVKEDNWEGERGRNIGQIENSVCESVGGRERNA
jgi:hypothetical protein